MPKKISIEDMADAILEELREYSETTEEDLERIAKKVAREGTKKLKATSPRRAGGRKGHYADGWGVKYIKNGNGKFSFVVHNKKKPGLTHLLEKGHQIVPGGGRVRAIPHIKQVEEWCNEEYERRAEAMLRG